MKTKLFIIALSLFSYSAYANDDKSIQEIIKNEYGDCYPTFQKQITYCKPSSCSYPDFSDAKSWRTHNIRGMSDGKCYVIYYSYLGKKIIGTPEHCFYNTDDLNQLGSLYATLFTTNSAIEMTITKDQINQLNRNICKSE